MRCMSNGEGTVLGSLRLMFVHFIYGQFDSDIIPLYGMSACFHNKIRVLQNIWEVLCPIYM